MAIVKRGNDTWLIRIFLGRENGKRKYFNETFKGKKKEAEALEIKKKNELNNGISIEHSKLTVGEYLDKWLEISAKGRLKERTYLDYIEYLKRYVRPKIGKMKLSKIKPLDIQAIYTWMLEKELSPRTVQYTHSILSSALKQAVKWQILPYNPATMTDRPQNHRKEMTVLSPEESIKFLETAKEDKFGIVFAIALTTGMRPEEYLGLRWKKY